jgi:hypothetical protein
LQQLLTVPSFDCERGAKCTWAYHGQITTGLNSEKEGKGIQLENFAILFVKKCVCNKMDLIKTVGLQCLENSEFTTRYAAVTQECLISVHDVRRKRRLLTPCTAIFPGTT